MSDHKTQRFNEYFEDLVNALCFGKISGKINKSKLKVHTCEIASGLYSVMTEDINQVAKIQIYLFGEITTNDVSSASSLKRKYIFFPDKILLQNKFDLVEIYTKEDYFNLSLQYDLSISYESLKFVQSLIAKINKPLSMAYAKEEEKYYGYV